MQAEAAPNKQIPSWWAVMGGQVLAYILTIVAVFVLYFIMSTIVNSVIHFGTLPAWVSWLEGVLLLLFAGVFLASVQRSVLRKWLPARRNWLLTGSLLLPLLALGVWGLLSRFVVPEPSTVAWWENYTPWVETGALVWKLSLGPGFIVGLAGGLLFGLAQSALLPWRRRLWWALSALAWGLAAALALAFANATIVMFGGPR